MTWEIMVKINEAPEVDWGGGDIEFQDIGAE